jgi:hypothetical protein
MKRTSWIAGFLTLLVVFAVSGCYTVLRHPTGDSAVYEGSYYRTCADCHADAAYYHPYYRYGQSHYRWRDYYGYPWWYDNYWWYPYDDDYEGDAPDARSGTGHLWGSGGWPSGGWGFHTPPPGQGSQPPAQPPPVRQPPPKVRPTEKTKTKEEPPEEKKKQEEKEPDKPLETERRKPPRARPTPRRDD